MPLFGKKNIGSLIFYGRESLLDIYIYVTDSHTGLEYSEKFTFHKIKGKQVIAAYFPQIPAGPYIHKILRFGDKPGNIVVYPNQLTKVDMSVWKSNK